MVFPVVVYRGETWTIKKAAHGILSSIYSLPQARILDWVAIPFSRGIFPTQGSNLGFLYCTQTPYSLNHREA